MNTVIIKFVQLQAQLLICHWQTKKYARHIAFERTYNSIHDDVDKFIESYQGKYGRFKVESDIDIKDLSELKMNEFCSEYVKLFQEAKDELDEVKDADLFNILDEMTYAINELRYLLTLE